MLAQQMLKETDLSVAEIAARLGDGEPSAFYRAFSKLAGTPPAEGFSSANLQLDGR